MSDLPVTLADIRRWHDAHPWEDTGQIQQDMLLERLMMRIASDDLLGESLAISGGTSLHKLWLPEPRRYSEDLDYALFGDHDTETVLRRISAVGARAGLRVPPRVRIKLKTQFPKAFLEFDDITDGRTRIIKIEVSRWDGLGTLECTTRISRTLEERWCQASADVLTMSAAYMTAAKLSALYSRRKGRDLMDFHIYVRFLGVQPSEVVPFFEHMKLNSRRLKRWTAHTGKRVLRAHLRSELFIGDLTTLAGSWATAAKLSDARRVHSDFAEEVHKSLRSRKEERRLERRRAARRPAADETTPAAAPIQPRRQRRVTGPMRAGPRCGKELPRGGVCGRRRNHPGRCRKSP